jgi:tripartite-type tricarboxylate transporter receptor subunit TctC
LPNVPTFAESGCPGYEAMNWYAFVVPAKTPPDILKRLNSEIVRALNDPEIRDKLRENGMDVTHRLEKKWRRTREANMRNGDES